MLWHEWRMFLPSAVSASSLSCVTSHQPVALHLCAQAFDPEFRKPFSNVERYFSTLAAQPEFQKVTGEAKLATEALKYTPRALTVLCCC